MVNQANTQEFLPGMEEKPARRVKLKPRHEEFCLAYVTNNNDGKAAYLAAFPDVSPESAKVLACKLLKKPAITERIAEIVTEMRDKLTTTVINYHRRVLTTDRRIYLDAFGSAKPVQELSDEAAAILEFEQVSSKDGVRTLLKLPTRHQSAVELSRILGLQKASVDLPDGTTGNVVVSITL